jgi:hypothetical protein
VNLFNGVSVSKGGFHYFETGIKLREFAYLEHPFDPLATSFIKYPTLITIL